MQSQAVPGRNVPEPPAEVSGTGQGGSFMAAFRAASTQNARAKRLPTEVAAPPLLQTQLSTPGTFLEKSVKSGRLGVWKASLEASRLAKDSPAPEEYEPQSCMDEVEPVSGGSMGDPALSARQPQAAAPLAPQLPTSPSRHIFQHVDNSAHVRHVLPGAQPPPVHPHHRLPVPDKFATVTGARTGFAGGLVLMPPHFVQGGMMPRGPSPRPPPFESSAQWPHARPGVAAGMMVSIPRPRMPPPRFHEQGPAPQPHLHAQHPTEQHFVSDSNTNTGRIAPPAVHHSSMPSVCVQLQQRANDARAAAADTVQLTRGREASPEQLDGRVLCIVPPELSQIDNHPPEASAGEMHEAESFRADHTGSRHSSSAIERGKASWIQGTAVALFDEAPKSPKSPGGSRIIGGPWDVGAEVTSQNVALGPSSQSQNESHIHQRGKLAQAPALQQQTHSTRLAQHPGTSQPLEHEVAGHKQSPCSVSVVASDAPMLAAFHAVAPVHAHADIGAMQPDQLPMRPVCPTDAAPLSTQQELVQQQSWQLGPEAVVHADNAPEQSQQHAQLQEHSLGPEAELHVTHMPPPTAVLQAQQPPSTSTAHVAPTTEAVEATVVPTHAQESAAATQDPGEGGSSVPASTAPGEAVARPRGNTRGRRGGRRGRGRGGRGGRGGRKPAARPAEVADEFCAAPRSPEGAAHAGGDTSIPSQTETGVQRAPVGKASPQGTGPVATQSMAAKRRVRKGRSLAVRELGLDISSQPIEEGSDSAGRRTRKGSSLPSVAAAATTGAVLAAAAPPTRDAAVNSTAANAVDVNETALKQMTGDRRSGAPAKNESFPSTVEQPVLREPSARVGVETSSAGEEPCQAPAATGQGTEAMLAAEPTATASPAARAGLSTEAVPGAAVARTGDRPLQLPTAGHGPSDAAHEPGDRCKHASEEHQPLQNVDAIMHDHSPPEPLEVVRGRERQRGRSRGRGRRITSGRSRGRRRSGREVVSIIVDSTTRDKPFPEAAIAPTAVAVTTDAPAGTQRQSASDEPHPRKCSRSKGSPDSLNADTPRKQVSQGQPCVLAHPDPLSATARDAPSVSPQADPSIVPPAIEAGGNGTPVQELAAEHDSAAVAVECHPQSPGAPSAAAGRQDVQGADEAPAEPHDEPHGDAHGDPLPPRAVPVEVDVAGDGHGSRGKSGFRAGRGSAGRPRRRSGRNRTEAVRFSEDASEDDEDYMGQGTGAGGDGSGSDDEADGSESERDQKRRRTRASLRGDRQGGEKQQKQHQGRGGLRSSRRCAVAARVAIAFHASKQHEDVSNGAGGSASGDDEQAAARSAEMATEATCADVNVVTLSHCDHVASSLPHAVQPHGTHHTHAASPQGQRPDSHLHEGCENMLHEFSNADASAAMDGFPDRGHCALAPSPAGERIHRMEKDVGALGGLCDTSPVHTGNVEDILAGVDRANAVGVSAYECWDEPPHGMPEVQEEQAWASQADAQQQQPSRPENQSHNEQVKTGGGAGGCSHPTGASHVRQKGKSHRARKRRRDADHDAQNTPRVAALPTLPDAVGGDALDTRNEITPVAGEAVTVAEADVEPVDATQATHETTDGAQYEALQLRTAVSEVNPGPGAEQCENAVVTQEAAAEAVEVARADIGTEQATAEAAQVALSDVEPANAAPEEHGPSRSHDDCAQPEDEQLPAAVDEVDVCPAAEQHEAQPNAGAQQPPAQTSALAEGDKDVCAAEAAEKDAAVDEHTDVDVAPVGTEAAREEDPSVVELGNAVLSQPAGAEAVAEAWFGAPAGAEAAAAGAVSQLDTNPVADLAESADHEESLHPVADVSDAGMHDATEPVVAELPVATRRGTEAKRRATRFTRSALPTPATDSQDCAPCTATNPPVVTAASAPQAPPAQHTEHTAEPDNPVPANEFCDVNVLAGGIESATALQPVQQHTPQEAGVEGGRGSVRRRKKNGSQGPAEADQELPDLPKKCTRTTRASAVDVAAPAAAAAPVVAVGSERETQTAAAVIGEAHAPADSCAPAFEDEPRTTRRGPIVQRSLRTRAHASVGGGNPASVDPSDDKRKASEGAAGTAATEGAHAPHPPQVEAAAPADPIETSAKIPGTKRGSGKAPRCANGKASSSKQHAESVRPAVHAPRRSSSGSGKAARSAGPPAVIGRKRPLQEIADGIQRVTFPPHESAQLNLQAPGNPVSGGGVGGAAATAAAVALPPVNPIVDQTAAPRANSDHNSRSQSLPLAQQDTESTSVGGCDDQSASQPPSPSAVAQFQDTFSLPGVSHSFTASLSQAPLPASPPPPFPHGRVHSNHKSAAATDAADSISSVPTTPRAAPAVSPRENDEATPAARETTPLHQLSTLAAPRGAFEATTEHETDSGAGADQPAAVSALPQPPPPAPPQPIDTVAGTSDTGEAADISVPLQPLPPPPPLSSSPVRQLHTVMDDLDEQHSQPVLQSADALQPCTAEAVVGADASVTVEAGAGPLQPTDGDVSVGDAEACEAGNDANPLVAPPPPPPLATLEDSTIAPQLPAADASPPTLTVLVSFNPDPVEVALHEPPYPTAGPTATPRQPPASCRLSPGPSSEGRQAVAAALQADSFGHLEGAVRSANFASGHTSSDPEPIAHSSSPQKSFFLPSQCVVMAAQPSVHHEASAYELAFAEAQDEAARQSPNGVTVAQGQYSEQVAANCVHRAGDCGVFSSCDRCRSRQGVVALGLEPPVATVCAVSTAATVAHFLEPHKGPPGTRDGMHVSQSEGHVENENPHNNMHKVDGCPDVEHAQQEVCCEERDAGSAVGPQQNVTKPIGTENSSYGILPAGAPVDMWGVPAAHKVIQEPTSPMVGKRGETDAPAAGPPLDPGACQDIIREAPDEQMCSPDATTYIPQTVHGSFMPLSSGEPPPSPEHHVTGPSPQSDVEPQPVLAAPWPDPQQGHEDASAVHTEAPSVPAAQLAAAPQPIQPMQRAAGAEGLERARRLAAKSRGSLAAKLGARKVQRTAGTRGVISRGSNVLFAARAKAAPASTVPTAPAQAATAPVSAPASSAELAPSAQHSSSGAAAEQAVLHALHGHTPHGKESDGADAAMHEAPAITAPSTAAHSCRSNPPQETSMHEQPAEPSSGLGDPFTLPELPAAASPATDRKDSAACMPCIDKTPEAQHAKAEYSETNPSSLPCPQAQHVEERAPPLQSPSLDQEQAQVPGHDRDWRMSRSRSRSPSPAAPAQATPASPAQATPVSPAQATPASPARAAPASPAQATPASPAQATPASPAQATSASPAQATPASPAQPPPPPPPPQVQPGEYHPFPAPALADPPSSPCPSPPAAEPKSVGELSDACEDRMAAATTRSLPPLKVPHTEEDTSATVTLSSPMHRMETHSTLSCMQATSVRVFMCHARDHCLDAERLMTPGTSRHRHNSETHSVNIPSMSGDDAVAARAETTDLGDKQMRTRTRARSDQATAASDADVLDADAAGVRPTDGLGSDVEAAGENTQARTSPQRKPGRRTLKIKYRSRLSHASANAHTTAAERLPHDGGSPRAVPMHGGSAAEYSGARACEFMTPPACFDSSNSLQNSPHAVGGGAADHLCFGADNVLEPADDDFPGYAWNFPQTYGIWDVGDHSPRGAVLETVDISPSNDPIGVIVGCGDDIEPDSPDFASQEYPMHAPPLLQSLSGNLDNDHVHTHGHMHEPAMNDGDAGILSNASVIAMRGGMNSVTHSHTNNTTGSGAGPQTLSSDAGAGGAGAHLSDASVGILPQPPLHAAHATMQRAATATADLSRSRNENGAGLAAAPHPTGLQHRSEPPTAAQAAVQAAVPRNCDPTWNMTYFHGHVMGAMPASEYAARSRSFRPSTGPFTSPRAAIPALIYSPLEDRGRARSADSIQAREVCRGMWINSVSGPFQFPETNSSKLGLPIPPVLPLTGPHPTLPPLRPHPRPLLLDSRSRSITPTPSSGSRGLAKGSHQATPISSGVPTPQQHVATPAAPVATGAAGVATSCVDSNNKDAGKPCSIKNCPTTSTSNGVIHATAADPPPPPASPPAEQPMPGLSLLPPLQAAPPTDKGALPPSAEPSTKAEPECGPGLTWGSPPAAEEPDPAQVEETVAEPSERSPAGDAADGRMPAPAPMSALARIRQRKALSPSPDELPLAEDEAEEGGSGHAAPPQPCSAQAPPQQPQDSPPVPVPSGPAPCSAVAVPPAEATVAAAAVGVADSSAPTSPPGGDAVPPDVAPAAANTEVKADTADATDATTPPDAPAASDVQPQPVSRDEPLRPARRDPVATKTGHIFPAKTPRSSSAPAASASRVPERNGAAVTPLPPPNPHNHINLLGNPLSAPPALPAQRPLSATATMQASTPAQALSSAAAGFRTGPGRGSLVRPRRSPTGRTLRPALMFSSSAAYKHPTTSASVRPAVPTPSDPPLSMPYSLSGGLWSGDLAANQDCIQLLNPLASSSFLPPLADVRQLSSRGFAEGAVGAEARAQERTSATGALDTEDAVGPLLATLASAGPVALSSGLHDSALDLSGMAGGGEAQSPPRTAAADSPSDTITASPPLPTGRKLAGAADVTSGPPLSLRGAKAHVHHKHSASGTTSTDGAAPRLRRLTDRSICKRHRVLFSSTGMALEEGQRVAYIENRKNIILQGTVRLAGNPAENNGNGGILCSHCSKVVSVPTFEHHAQHQHNRSAFENTFTLSEEGYILQRLRDIASGHQDDFDASGGSEHAAPSATLSKPHLLAASSMSTDVADRSGDAQSRRTAAYKMHAVHASDLKTTYTAVKGRRSAPATTAAPPQVEGARQKRSVPDVNGLEAPEATPPEKLCALEAVKIGKESKRLTKNKRVRSGRRTVPLPTGSEGPSGATVLLGGLDLESMWALDIEGLPFSDAESAPADGEEAEAEEAEPVIGDAAADSTFLSCVQRTQRPPQFLPPAAEMAETTDHGTCMLCFQPDFHPGPSFSDRTMIVCDSCEREYHVGCLRACGLGALAELPAGEWFCSPACFGILKDVRAKHMAGPWPVPSSKSSQYTLQVILGRAKRSIPHTHRSMREVLAVLREGFDPIVDETSGRDLAELMVLGQTTEKFDFQNMFSIVLRIGAEPVVAAVARVFGPLLVEVPLIATRRSARRQGHARVLLEGLADWLAGQKVDQIMLPAHDEALDTWTRGFGFVKLEKEEIDTIRQHLRMVQFPGTTLMKLPTDRSLWPAKTERAPVVTDAKSKRKLQVAAPIKSTKYNRKSSGGTGPRAARGLKWGGTRADARADADYAGHAATDGKAEPASPLPQRRRRTGWDQGRSYAQMDRGDSDDGGASVAVKVPEAPVAVTTKSGRVAKRPRPPDEDPERSAKLNSQQAALAKKARRVKLDEWLEQGLANVDCMAVIEPQLPEEWRAEVSACIEGSGVDATRSQNGGLGSGAKVEEESRLNG